jgi:hypothetical protein
MHLQGLLHKLFGNAANFIDKRIHAILLQSAETLPSSAHLSLTSIGRSLSSATTVKHNIKRIDRLFSNRTLHNKGVIYFEVIAKHILNDNKRPTIIVDWSGLTRCGEFHMLSANVCVGGRALPILTKSYHESEYLKRKTHENFLLQLSLILPKDCHPIIVTDAGFRNPWFKLVVQKGWDFVGRVRHNTQYRLENIMSWKTIKSLYSLATPTPYYLFKAYLAKENPLKCYFYIYKEKHKNRVKKNLRGKKVRCSSSKKHEKSAKEPWLIVTSISTDQLKAKQIIDIYKSRMQIEEYFRDLKNTKNGFGLRHCRSFQKDRLNVALLIGGIAAFMLWIIGLMTIQKNMHFSFQSNTLKSRNVLSVFSIGWQALKQKHLSFNPFDIKLAIIRMKLCAFA